MLRSQTFTDNINQDIDLLFLCLGHGESSKFLQENLINEKIKIIDLANDFRLKEHASIGNRSFIYGLAALNLDDIKSANNIANPGCFATAVLLINNIRDLDTDKASNKKTLAARIGRKPALVIFALLLLAPFVLLTPFWLVAPATFIVNLLLIPVVIIILIATSAKTPKELILALQLTSYTSLLFAIGFNWGLVNVTF